jgi:hypothetical protein
MSQKAIPDSEKTGNLPVPFQVNHGGPLFQLSGLLCYSLARAQGSLNHRAVSIDYWC